MGRKHRDGGGRSLFKPAFWMFSLCGLMVSGITVAEKFASEESPMNQLSGLLAPSTAEGSTGAPANKKGVTLITPSGKLTDEQRAWLLEQAKKGAPIPINEDGEPVSAESQRDATLKQLEAVIGKTGGNL